MRIYLDHNATTPLREEVVDAMLPALREGFGNPSSTHAEGAAARMRVERAREQVAAALAVAPDEVFFTAGATESNNAVLYGVLREAQAAGGAAHLVTTPVEHPSVVEPRELLEREGVAVSRVAVDGDGLLDLGAFEKALDQQGTVLASVIWANNETGVVQPVAEIGVAAKQRGVPLHVDATQALGKIRVDLQDVPVDFLSCSAHKLNGPKGVGALVVRKGREIPPLLTGGPQEKRRRGGTENVASIVGFGVACELAQVESDVRAARYAALRDRLWEGIAAKVPRVRRNGHPEQVLPNTLSVEIIGAPGEVILQALDLEGVAASAGAACHSGSITPSHVLSAMGRTPEQARSSLRLSVGVGVDEGQIDRAVELIAELASRARGAESP
ncbi:MAG: cysteine desulfurase family protein [Myxococcota bacterium]